MKLTIAAAILAVLSASALAQNSHYVQPHVTRNGTFVPGHMQTNPDSSRLNNWSTQGNVNPYTGQSGSVNPWNTPAPAYTPPPANPFNAQPYGGAQPFQVPNPYAPRY
jgi:hypothetical protein